MQIQHEENHAQGAFFILDNQQQRVAELTYYFVDEKRLMLIILMCPKPCADKVWRISYIKR